MVTDKDFGYESWLRKLVLRDGKAPNGKRYTLGVLSRLYMTEFYALLPLDEDRGLDGINLREQYLEENPSGGEPYKPDYNLNMASERIAEYDTVPHGPANMLEVLIALTKRLLWGLDSDESLYDRFWWLVNNIGLYEHYSDDEMTEQKLFEIRKRLDKILTRTHGRDGKGGLFPLKLWGKGSYPVDFLNRDQRTIEIFNQMDAYLQEVRLGRG